MPSKPRAAAAKSARPIELLRFERLMYGAVALTVGYDFLEPACGRLFGLAYDVTDVIADVAIVVVMSVLIWLTVRRRKYWAGWALVGLTCFSGGSLMLAAGLNPDGMMRLVQTCPGVSSVEFVIAIVEIAAFALLFSQPSRDWLKQ
jgi:hypothetical protein